jgi:hypothetical protein
MQDSNFEPNQVWKWDLQLMWPEALPSRLFRLAKSLWNQGNDPFIPLQYIILDVHGQY